jgi:succinate dehydrogenase/fumarate reductase flavoprotein subunit
MSDTRTVDFVVVGTGAAGVSAAIYAASSGKTVMLCEKVRQNRRNHRVVKCHDLGSLFGSREREGRR